jgi:tetratricopeptide (TPR) repeat protein
MLIGNSCKGNPKAVPVTEETQQTEVPPEEYAQLGNKMLYVDWKFEEAKAALHKAVALNPEDDLSHANLAWYWMLEENKAKSMEHITKAKQANPEKMLWVQWHGWICYFYDDFECAEKYLKEAIVMEPKQRDAYFTLARMYYRNGNTEMAKTFFLKAAEDSTGRGPQAFYYIINDESDKAREIVSAMEQDPKGPYELLGVVPLNNMLGDREKALALLEKNFEMRQPLLPWLRFMPIMRPLHEEQQFQDLVARIGGPNPQ